jgi:F-box and WD-40 domain protein 1/11
VKVLGVPKSGANNSMTSPIGQRMKDQKPFASVNPTREWLDEQATPRLMNHHGSILCLQFDSNIMVTGSSDNTLIIWDLTSDYQPIHRLEQHTAGVLDVCFDSKHIVSCSKDTTICLWDRKTGSLIRTFSGHRGPVNAVQLRGNLIVSASGDAFAKLWDIESGNCIKEFASKDRGLACVDFSPDSKTILVGGNDQVIYQFDANTGELVRELTGHSGLVRSLHLDSVNRRVISGSYDYSVKAFDASNGDLLCDFVGWTTSWMLSAKADYRRIVATSQDGRVVIMDFGYALKGIELLES